MRLRELRKQKGLTQNQLAELIDVEQGEISKLETTDRKPNMATVERIADALDVEIGDLFSDRTDEEQFLVEAFRSLSPGRRKGWIDMARAAKAEEASEKAS